MNVNRPQAFQGIQMLRAIAALLVMFLHGRKLINLESFPLGDCLFGRGAIGVNLFFVISGFIMVHTTREALTYAPNEAIRFLLKRCIRIAPLYFLLTLTFISIQGDWSYYIKQGHWDQLLRVFLFLPDTVKTPLWVGWSLNYEFFFYLVFALSFFIGQYRNYILLVILSSLVLVLPLAAGQKLSMAVDPLYFDSPYLNMMASPFMWHFAAGMAVAILEPKMAGLKPYAKTILILCISLFTSIYAFIPESALPDLLASTLLLFGVVQAERNGVFSQVPKIALKLGDASYSIYLMHWMVQLFLPVLFTKLGWELMAHGPLLAIWIWTLTLVLSLMAWNWFEKPLQSYLRKKIRS